MKRHSEAYEAGRRALAAAAARLGTVNLSPSMAQRDDWGLSCKEFMAGWNAEKRRGNPGRRMRKNPTKAQKREKTRKASVQRRVASALVSSGGGSPRRYGR
jgi:hypothetical protein